MNVLNVQELRGDSVLVNLEHVAVAFSRDEGELTELYVTRLERPLVIDMKFQDFSDAWSQFKNC